MIIKNNPLLYVNLESEKAFDLQLVAGAKGFTWANGNKTYNPYFPTYALVFNFTEKRMFYYPTGEALFQLPDGKRTLKEMRILLSQMEDQK